MEPATRFSFEAYFLVPPFRVRCAETYTHQSEAPLRATQNGYPDFVHAGRGCANYLDVQPTWEAGYNHVSFRGPAAVTSSHGYCVLTLVEQVWVEGGLALTRTPRKTAPHFHPFADQLAKNPFCSKPPNPNTPPPPEVRKSDLPTPTDAKPTPHFRSLAAPPMGVTGPSSFRKPWPLGSSTRP